MAETTPLDTAHAAMLAAPADDSLRLRFYERMADSELFVMLAEEARGGTISPDIYDVADGRFALAFDRQERLSAFAGRPVAYAAVSGRVLAALLDGRGVGIGLNLGVAPSSFLAPAEAVAWLHRTLGNAPDRVEAGIAKMAAPAGLPAGLVSALDTKLATAGGMARCACLVAVTYRDGGSGHLLGFIDAVPGAEPALTRAVAEVLTFSGIDAAVLDVGFFERDAPVARSLVAAGLRYDLPPAPESRARQADTRARRTPPGSDPDRPPILK